jgi:hypothetical protein
MTINVVEKIDDLIRVKHILVSVSDKQGLDDFIPELLGDTWRRCRILPETGFRLHGAARNPGRSCEDS